VTNKPLWAPKSCTALRMRSATSNAPGKGVSGQHDRELFAFGAARHIQGANATAQVLAMERSASSQRSRPNSSLSC
jgi:hypothetical protein